MSMDQSINPINPMADIRTVGERSPAPWQETFLAGLLFLLNAC
jgi:hypothetical protein